MVDPKSAEMLPTPNLERTADLDQSAEALDYEFARMVVLFEKREYAEGLTRARKAVQLLNSMPNLKDRDSEEYRPEYVASIYTLAAELAQLNREHGTAEEWAANAVDLAPTPERFALHVLTLIHSGRTDEAAAIMSEVLARGDDVAEQFQEIVRESGVLKQAVPVNAK